MKYKFKVQFGQKSELFCTTGSFLITDIRKVIGGGVGNFSTTNFFRSNFLFGKISYIIFFSWETFWKDNAGIFWGLLAVHEFFFFFLCNFPLQEVFCTLPNPTPFFKTFLMACHKSNFLQTTH